MSLTPFERSAETDINLRNHTFFHGAKNLADLESIRREGFRTDFTDEDGRWLRDGNLGVGIYLSCNWKTALWFGPVLLRVTLQQGTRVFDASVPPSQDELQALVRRFGKEILASTDVRRTIPSNKSLRFDELSALFRHHYQHTWHSREGFARAWSSKRSAHSRALEYCVTRLKHCGFHGYGHPADDNGIVIFQPDRITLEEIVAYVPERDYSRLTDSITLTDLCMAQLKRRFSLPPELANGE